MTSDALATLVLASASAGRLATLRSAGVEPLVLVSGFDESSVDTTDAVGLCTALARLKAEAVAQRLRVSGELPDGRPVVLGCDSVLEIDGEVHGKPANAAQAVARWRAMRGRTGILHTGHCLLDLAGGSVVEEVGSTTVTFTEVTDEEVDAYVATGEPLRVAGAFTIDSLGGWFVERIEGDAGNVVGVSLPLLRRLLARLGVSVPALWAGTQRSSQ